LTHEDRKAIDSNPARQRETEKRAFTANERRLSNAKPPFV
jgi:hypothetical protein